MEKPDQKTQNKIIEGYINGNAREFFIVTRWIEQVVHHYSWGLNNYSDDIIQDVRLKLYVNLKDKKFRRASLLKTYVFRIAKYTCIDFLRKTYAQSDKNQQPDDIQDTVNVLDDIVVKEKEKIVQIILNEIAVMCRELLQFVFLEKLSYKEISAIMSIAEGTVKSRVSRCIRKAVELKQKYWNE